MSRPVLHFAAVAALLIGAGPAFTGAAEERPNEQRAPAASHFEIEAKFVEVTRKILKEELGSLGGFLPASKAAPALTLNRVLEPADAEELLRTLIAKRGVDLLSAPRVTTGAGEEAKIEIKREFRYPVSWEPKVKGKPHRPKDFETKDTGVTLRVKAKPAPEGVINLDLDAAVVEFAGVVKIEAGKASAQALIERGPRGALALTVEGPHQPIFSTRRVQTSVSLFDKRTVVLSFPNETEKTPARPQNAANERHLLAIVTVRKKPAEEAAR